MHEITLTINGQKITAPLNTTILDAAKLINVKIPVLCDFPGLKKRAVCRICTVEVNGKSKLVPACSNKIEEGMNVVTFNERIFRVRKTILELILMSHGQNCLFCVKNTKCEFQSLIAEYNCCEISKIPIMKKTNVPLVEKNIARDLDKCIKCLRCTEVCEKEKIMALGTSHRSFNLKIDTPYNQSLEQSKCNFCLECTKVCPCGAIYEV